MRYNHRMIANTQMAILDRVIKPEANGITPDTARFILTMTFEPQDHERMDGLAEKARQGTLTDDDRAELDEYRRAADLLALLHSKARLALKRAGLNP